jgi:non-specific serine/threonine protein kinase/serine/threonine-protein kinase
MTDPAGGGAAMTDPASLAPERWERLMALFDELVELQGAERDRRLVELAEADDDLVPSLERLLVADAGTGHDVLERAPGFHDGPTEPTLSDEAMPERAGPYRLVGLLGRGGMADVYAGERQGGGFAQRVAVKVLRRGLDTQDLLSRFLRERRILAGLEHPAIARLLDGGELADGRPYLAMERVDGLPIHRHAERQGLSVEQRLALLRTACEAVAFAHRNLVVHRDVKPSNVMVTERGEVKLLDFGIAKLLAADGDDVALTATVGRLLTPAYAAPEQRAAGAITTATDVWGLGTVAYELLVGEPPLAAAGDGSRAPLAAAGNGSWAPLALPERSPPRPSARVLALRGDTAEGRRWAARLTGDVDVIVQKALAIDPARRYESAQALAEDIDRHLTGRPVRARADSFAYRARKFVLRHRTPVAAGVLLVLSLVAGVTTTLRQARRADEQRARAERRFQDVRRMANSFLFEFHDAIADIPGTTRARELVVRRALEYLASLAAEVEDNDTLSAELASAYERVGEVQGLPYSASLGDMAGALSSFERAYAIRVDLLRKKPHDAERLAAACGAGRRLGRVLLAQADVPAAAARSREFLPLCEEAWRLEPDLGSTPEALRARILAGDLRFRLVDFAAARALFEGVIAQVGPRTDRAALLAAGQAFDRLSQISERVGDVPAALRFRRRTVELDEQLVAGDPGNAYLRRGLGDDYSLLTVLLSKAGDHPAALAAADRGYAIFEVLSKEDPNDARAALDLAGILMRRGKVMRAAGRVEAALATLSEARTRAEDALRRSPDSGEAIAIAAETLDEIGTSLTQMGRFGEAVPALQGSLAKWEAPLTRDPQNPEILHAIAALHRSLGFALRRQGLLTEACRSYARAVEMVTGLKARAVPPIPTPQQIDALKREQAPCAGRS